MVNTHYNQNNMKKYSQLQNTIAVCSIIKIIALELLIINLKDFENNLFSFYVKNYS